jgi:hypothetical protein
MSLLTNACFDNLHSFCGGYYEGITGSLATDAGRCGCECHLSKHITDAKDPLACWCHPYRDTEQPEIIVHRKAGAA